MGEEKFHEEIRGWHRNGGVTTMMCLEVGGGPLDGAEWNVCLLRDPPKCSVLPERINGNNRQK